MEDSLVAERDRLVEDLATVVQSFDDHSDVLQDCPGVAPIRQIAEELKAQSEQMLEDGRLLRLGIVGQIKAGKSTLLNLLLFNGQEVLPRAATPMTASLTHIVQSDEVATDQAQIDVEYYSCEEWLEIRSHADEYGKAKEAGRSLDGFLRASHELVEMAKKRGRGIPDHTTDTQTVSMDDLNGQLRSLVGAEGNLTPFVKSVTIRCGGAIEDLDIVDTPGLNDPIVSRIQATHKLLADCDAVLLLSYAGQFLDSTDVELLRRTLPREGIRRCVLMGSKFDSAVVDVALVHRRNLEAGIQGVEEQLRDRARTELERTRHEDEHLAIDDDDVLFLSATCAIQGAKPYAQWSGAERAAFDVLRESYPDWLDGPENGALNEETIRNLKMLGRQDDLYNVISRIRDDRDEIIANKLRDYLRQKRRSVGNEIDALIELIRREHDELSTVDLERLRNRKSALQDTIARIADDVSDKWATIVRAQTQQRDKIEADCHEEVSDARESIQEFARVQIETEKKEKPRGLLGIREFFRRLSNRSNYEIVPYEKRVLDLQALRLFLDGVYSNVNFAIRKELDRLFDHDFLIKSKGTLRGTMADVLDDETAAELGWSVTRSLDRAVEKIAANAKADVKRYRAENTGTPIEVTGGVDVEEVQDQARNWLNTIENEVKMQFTAARGVAETAIERATRELLPVATRDLERYSEYVGRDIERREFKQERYERVIGALSGHRARLRPDDG